MARRLAPFIYIAVGFLADLLFSEKIAGVVWTVGALVLAAMYSLGFGRRRRTLDSQRPAEPKA